MPVDAATIRAVQRAAKKSSQSLAHAVRQSINLGLPQVERIHSLDEKHRPKCLKWLDEYPLSPVAARDTKSALKDRIALNNGLPC